MKEIVELIADKEKELREVAKALKHAKEIGNDQEEAIANSEYARLVKEINDLKVKLAVDLDEKENKNENDLKSNDPIKTLIANKEKELREVAKALKHAKEIGNDQEEAIANSEYARLVKEINDLKVKLAVDQDEKRSSTSKNTQTNYLDKKIDEIRKKMGEILKIKPYDGIENEYEHSITYQLDDWEVDEFQDLREKLKKLIDEKVKQQDSGLKEPNARGEDSENPRSKKPELGFDDPNIPSFEDPEPRFDDPNIPDSEDPNSTMPDPSKLPIRSFWEIYNSTCTEHTNNLAIKIHNFANMKCLPKKDDSTVTKILKGTLCCVPPVLPLIKLGAKIANSFTNTDKKLNRMRENINNLSKEEFEVLVSNSENANKKTNQLVKEDYDTDYLDPQFMKQYKVNELYLQAVGERLSKERLTEIENYNRMIESIDQRINELENSENLSNNEKIEYNEITKIKQQCKNLGIEDRKEIDTFNEGVKKKSSGFKNIKGWFLAKFNPDNREENEKMAKLSEQRRLEHDSYQKNKYSNKMEDYSKNQTNIKGRKNNKIDIGKYSIEGPIEMLDKGQQTNGRLLLTNLMTIACVLNMAKQISNNSELTNTINEHNAKIESHNKTVQELDKEIPVSDIPGAKEAIEGYNRQGVEEGFNSAERSAITGSYLGKAPYKVLDQEGHEYWDEINELVTELHDQGNFKEALRVMADAHVQKRPEYEANIFPYAEMRPEFIYSPMDENFLPDLNNIVSFLDGNFKLSDLVNLGKLDTIEVKNALNSLPIAMQLFNLGELSNKCANKKPTRPNNTRDEI